MWLVNLMKPKTLLVNFLNNQIHFFFWIFLIYYNLFKLKSLISFNSQSWLVKENNKSFNFILLIINPILFVISNSIINIKFVALNEDINDKFLFLIKNFYWKENIINNITLVNFLLVLNYIYRKIIIINNLI